MRIITMDLDKEVAAVQDLCDNIRDNEELQEMMAAGDGRQEISYSQMQRIAAILRQNIYSHTYINSIFAIGLNKQVYDPLYQIPPYNKIIPNYKDLDEFIASGKFNAFSAPTDFPGTAAGTNNVDKSEITFFTQYMSNYNFKQLGYILISIKREQLFRDISDIHKQMFDFACIIDQNGEIIYRIGAVPFDDGLIQAYGRESAKNNKVSEIAGEEYFLISQSLNAYPDWKVVGGIAYGKVKEDARLILNIVYLIGIVSVFIALVISYLLSKKVTDPILEINNAMAMFEEHKWPDPLPAKTSDELGSLTRGFNHMVEQFQNLLEQVQQEHREKIAVEVKTLELRLELLQAQINPHFIHNTLNALQYLALKRGADDIRELIQSFNLLLRASMSESRDFVTVREELELVDSYISIQRYRYDNEIEVIYQVADRLKEVIIPKLILQPIVENALYHGIIPKDCRGIIKIVISEEREEITVLVSDNGVGMDGQELAGIFSGKERSAKAGFNNMGLNNINARLRLYYGEDYSLFIRSEPGKGTSVWFHVPGRKEQEGGYGQI